MEDYSHGPEVVGEVVEALFARLVAINSADFLYCHGLLCLAQQGEIPTNADLADLFDMQPASVTRLVKRLRQHALAVMPAHCIYHPSNRSKAHGKEEDEGRSRRYSRSRRAGRRSATPAARGIEL
jgi:hypothetical protein